MKTLILFSFFALMSLITFAQSKTIPDKQTSVIYLKVTGAANDNYKAFARLILENGYIIEKSDPEFLTINTSPKSLAKHPGWSHTWYFNVLFSDDKITIQPFWRANVEISIGSVKSVDTPFKWHYAKSKSNIENMIYDELIELVNKYPETEITYN